MNRFIVQIMFFFMGKTLQYLSKHDEVIEKGCTAFKDGEQIALSVIPTGPELHLQKKESYLQFINVSSKNGLYPPNTIFPVHTRELPNLTIAFKHIIAAYKVVTMQKPFYTAYAEHLAIVYGEITKAVIMYRIFNQLQFILLPRFIARKVLKRLPHGGFDVLCRKALLYVWGMWMG